MSDIPSMLVESDLRRLYAKINAHTRRYSAPCYDCFVNESDNPPAALESLRASAMEEGDSMTMRRNDPNPDFTKEGMLETLEFIASTFAYLKQDIG